MAAASPAESYTAPSKLTKAKFKEQMIRLSKAPGFDKEVAGIVAAILQEMDTSDPETRKAMIVRLKDIHD